MSFLKSSELEKQEVKNKYLCSPQLVPGKHEAWDFQQLSLPHQQAYFFFSFGFSHIEILSLRSLLCSFFFEFGGVWREAATFTYIDE